MSESFLTLAAAIANADKFSAFLRGVSVSLPTGESVKLKFARYARQESLPGYRFLKYGYLTEITGGGFAEGGCGESNYRLVALQKSIAEAVERILYRILKGSSSYGTPNSNGWAAHYSLEHAQESADLELAERDAVLAHWHCETPFLELAPASFPSWLRRWSQTELCYSEYPLLRVLVSYRGYAPTISTLLMNDAGHGVISHSAGRNIEEALIRALAESCRLGQMAASRMYVDHSRALAQPETISIHAGPPEQAVAYAHHFTFPAWIFGKMISIEELRLQWKLHWSLRGGRPPRTTFTEVLKGPLSVGFSTSPDIQRLYFGRTTDGVQQGAINMRRLHDLGHAAEPHNLLPHFVA